VEDRELAEDVAQEALIRAVRKFRSLPNREEETPWLRQIIVRRARTALSRRRPGQAPMVEASECPDLENDLAVRAVLARLPDAQRLLLALAIGEQLSYAEISQALEIPVGTVASRLNAAKAAFRKLWETSA
jgi:RNA polymerase sigma-70 factor (ECF subfamily)